MFLKTEWTFGSLTWVFVSIYHGKKVEAEEDQKTKAMAVKIIEHVKILSSAFQMRRPMADGMETG